MPLCVPQPTLGQTAPAGLTAERSSAEARGGAEAAVGTRQLPQQQAELVAPVQKHPN